MQRFPGCCLAHLSKHAVIFLVAFAEGEQKLAKGDSGGGAVVERDGVWYLQGVVSLRQGTDDFTFTNVTHADHLQWMKDVLKL